MNQPVEARDDCYRKIGGGVAGEFDDRLIVRQLAQVAVQQQGLLVGIAKQGELPARHAQEVAEGLQTAVVANRRLVAGGIGRASLAGRIDQLAAIGIVEILLCAPLDLLNWRLRAVFGGHLWFLCEWPPVHAAPVRTCYF